MIFKLTLINGQEVSVYNLDRCGMCGSNDLMIDQSPYYGDEFYRGFSLPPLRKPLFSDLSFACHQCGYKQIFRYEQIELIEP